MEGLATLHSMLKLSTTRMHHLFCSRSFVSLHNVAYACFQRCGHNHKVLCRSNLSSHQWSYSKRRAMCHATLGLIRKDSLRKNSISVWHKHLISQPQLCGTPFNCHSTLSQTIICDVSRGIDRDELWQTHHLQCRDVLQKDNKRFQRRLDEHLELKCKEYIGQFDDVLQRRLKIIQLEHSFLFSEGYSVPSTESMTNKRWLEAMTFGTMDERLEFYISLESHDSQGENASHAEDQTEVNKTNMDESALPQAGSVDVNDIVGHSSERLSDLRLERAKQHGIPLLIDMDFIGHMTCQELDVCGEQLWRAYCTNREHKNPFHIVLSRCQPDNALYRYMQLLHQGDNPHFLATITQQSPLDLFPPSKLVYFSPKAKKVLTEFDPNSRYILGAYSNVKTIKHPCIMKAHQENISVVRLPIDEHVQWPGGPKNLVLQDILQVLLAVKEGSSWKDALTPIVQNGATIPPWILEAQRAKENVRSHTKSVTHNEKKRNKL